MNDCKTLRVLGLRLRPSGLSRIPRRAATRAAPALAFAAAAFVGLAACSSDPEFASAAQGERAGWVGAALSPVCGGKEDGFYCDSDSLVTCVAGVQTKSADCASGCLVGPALGDARCADDLCDLIPNGNYCVPEESTIYACVDNRTERRTPCVLGCAAATPGGQDGCRDCAPGRLLCGGTCLDGASDSQNCGACGHVCSGGPPSGGGTAVCHLGACALACSPGLADCDAAPENGCEANLDSVATCGACGVACPSPPNASAMCAAGACGFTCVPGFADQNGVAGDGCEVDLNEGAGGACASGFGDCNGAAVDGCETPLAADANNCGACGHTCGGGACADGRCAPTVIASLATGTPMGLAVDTGGIYWTQFNWTASALYHCPISGCAGPPVPFATEQNYIGGLALAGGRLYYANNGGGGRTTVMRIGTDGGGLVTFAVDGNGESVAVDAGSVYWTHNGSLDRLDINAAPPAASGFTTVLTGLHPVGTGSAAHQQIAFDATRVFTLDPGTAGAPDGRILACNKASSCGGNPEVLAAGIASPRGAVVASGRVFFTSAGLDDTGGLYSVPVGGGAVARLAQTPGAQGVAADGVNVYWATTNGGTGGVFACPLAGCAPTGPLVIASGAPAASVALDTLAVYWAAVAPCPFSPSGCMRPAAQASILRLPKPGGPSYVAAGEVARRAVVDRFAAERAVVRRRLP